MSHSLFKTGTFPSIKQEIEIKDKYKIDMMTANEVRESFKKFFEGKGHKIVPSAPMVIKDDPTLMFTNAGMNQWKDIILGTKDQARMYVVLILRNVSV